MTHMKIERVIFFTSKGAVFLECSREKCVIFSENLHLEKVMLSGKMKRMNFQEKIKKKHSSTMLTPVPTHSEKKEEFFNQNL